MLGPDGRVQEWNARAERIFARDAHAAAGLPLSALALLPEGDKGLAALLDSAARSGYADHAGECARGDGSRFPAQMLVTAIRREGALAGYSVVVLNTTAQTEAQQRRQDDNARLVSIIQSAMDAIITVDEEQGIVLFNAAAERIFRLPAAEAIGGPLDRLIPARYRSVHRGHIERFSTTGVTQRRMGDRTVLSGLRADGEEFPLEASISQVKVAGKKVFTVILRDITERQRTAEEVERSHRQLHELYAAMHEVREAERTRIARELHDELAQWLTALKMDTSWLMGRIDPQQEPLVARLEKMKIAVDTTVAAVRRIAADLRPVMLDDLGLVPALESLLHEFSERTGIVVSLEDNAQDMEFREPLVSAVYRMVQEALTNVARHAHATAVDVGIHVDSARLLVQVRDNGRGIRPADLEARKSYGLLGIRERAHTLGGAAIIYTPESGGTAVEIDIPLGPHNSGAQRQ